jgi:hypothetical protein
VSNKHMVGCLRPSIWTTTIFKNFLIAPLKSTIFEKFTFTICFKIFFIFSFAPHVYESCRPQISVQTLWQTADHQADLLSPVTAGSQIVCSREQTGYN